MEQEYELPYITEDLEGIGGKIKQEAENFIVEEVPLYPCSGQGEHLYINLTKENLTTREVCSKLREIFNLKKEDVGAAGLKDKNAKTTQTISLRFGNFNGIVLDEVKEKIEKEFSSVKVNWMKKHENKLRSGHLLGNKFRIKISNLNCNIEEAEKRVKIIIEKLKETGLPNYYGEQRFGKNQDNWQEGMAVLRGEKKIYDKWMKKFLLSSVQSYLFNLYLSERIKHGFFNRLLTGDIAKKTDTGGLFYVENLEKEQERFDKKEIIFTGPMFGDGLMEARGESGNFEKEILNRFNINEKFLGHGLRRRGKLIIDYVFLEIDEDKTAVWISFFLPKGSFATVFLRELMKND